MTSRSWLKQIVAWIRRSLGWQAGDDRPDITILEQVHAPGVTILRLNNTAIPGLCDMWRIDRHDENVQLFICVINCATLRQDLGALGKTLDAVMAGKGAVTEELRSQLNAQKNILATHYWITGINVPTSGVDAQGRRYRSNKTVDLELIACDLQGINASFAGDRFAKLFARKITKRLAACEFREFSHSSESWRSAVEKVLWLEWLEGLSRTHIDLYHVLQPKRSLRDDRRSARVREG